MARRGERRWHNEFLQDERIERWYRNLARRNVSTADVYLRRCASVLHSAKNMSPIDLLSMTQEELDNVAMDCVDHMLGKGLAGSTVEQFRKALASFLHWHNLELRRPLHIPGAFDAPKAEASKIPEPANLADALAASNHRNAAMLSLVAFGGLRLQVIGNIDASDGLVIGDLPDLVIKGRTVEFKHVPAQINVRKTLSKNNKPYVTFIGPEGCHYVRAYLEWRLLKGEKLTAKTPLVSPFGGEPRFCLRNNVGDCIRRVMRPSGIMEPPYIWRSYFGNRCLMAESKGLPASFRKFFMGHSGGIQGRYTLQKQLPADMVEEMRQTYAKAIPFLETRTMEKDDVIPDVLAILLQGRGLSQAEIQEMNLASKSKDELADMLADVMQPVETAAAAAVAPLAPKQKLAGAEEVESLLADGWIYKASLPDGRVIVEAA